MCALESVDISGRECHDRPWLHYSCDDDARDGSDVASRRKTLVYLDPWAFTRDCIGRWLQGSLDGFELYVLSDPEEIEPLADDEGQIWEVIINTGPERMSSAMVTRTLARVSAFLPAVPITILSHHEDPESIREAFELGVCGYVPASLAGQVAVGAVNLVSLGGMFAPVGALLSQAAPPPQEPAGDALIEGFTHRQSQILDCLRRGMANKLIAYELSMCESTVKVHIRNIMKKLNATNRTEVAYLTRNFFRDAGQPPLCER